MLAQTGLKLEPGFFFLISVAMPNSVVEQSTYCISTWEPTFEHFEMSRRLGYYTRTCSSIPPLYLELGMEQLIRRDGEQREKLVGTRRKNKNCNNFRRETLAKNIYIASRVITPPGNQGCESNTCHNKGREEVVHLALRTRWLWDKRRERWQRLETRRLRMRMRMRMRRVCIIRTRSARRETEFMEKRAKVRVANVELFFLNIASSG